MAIRVLIVDDSPFVREVLREILSRYSDIHVVGEAQDGKRAAQMVAELHPDVITMDVVMPLVGGIEAIQRIMQANPTPIIVVSDAHASSKELSMRAIENGAIDAFFKPPAGFDQTAADRLAATVRSAAQVSVVPRRAIKRYPMPKLNTLKQRLMAIEIVGIVASTGGPQTLHHLFASLHRPLAVPVALVQHTSVGFAPSLVSWLASVSNLPVKIARHQRRLRSGTIYVAPDDAHMEIDYGGTIHLHRGPKVASHRPSGTLLLRSLARTYGRRAAAIILTGMGSDGADGACEIERSGGSVLVEIPSAAIVDGMPQAAIARTAKPIVAPVQRIATLLDSMGHHRR